MCACSAPPTLCSHLHDQGERDTPKDDSLNVDKDINGGRRPEDQRHVDPHHQQLQDLDPGVCPHTIQAGTGRESRGEAGREGGRGEKGKEGGRGRGERKGGRKEGRGRRRKGQDRLVNSETARNDSHDETHSTYKCKQECRATATTCSSLNTL